MKTTFDISESLLSKAKAVSVKQKVTVKQLVEEGLRIVLANYSRPKKSPAKITPHVVTGKEVNSRTWGEIKSILEEEELLKLKPKD